MRIPLTALVFLTALLASCNATPSASNSSRTPSTSTTSTSPPSAPITGEVNLYSARHYNTDQALYDNFTAKTGIKVNLIEGKDTELLERIKTEGAKSPADILITVDAGRLWAAEEAGLLKPIQSTVLEAHIPANARHPQGKWFGLSERARVILYNNRKIKPSDLSTYEDLANPKWKGQLCIRSSNSVYNQSLVASRITLLGEPATEQWLRGLVANFARSPQGGDINQIEAIAQGICNLAVSNHYYFARVVASKTPKDQMIVKNIGLFFPKPTHTNISGAGVVTTAPHPDNAVKFLEYLVTPEAQKFFAEANHEYPIVKDAPVNDPVLESFGPYTSDKVNVASYGSNQAKAIALMDQVGWK